MIKISKVYNKYYIIQYFRTFLNISQCHHFAKIPQIFQNGNNLQCEIFISHSSKTLHVTILEWNCFIAKQVVQLVTKLSSHFLDWGNKTWQDLDPSQTPTNAVRLWWYIYYDEVSVCLSRKIITSLTGLSVWL